MIHHEAFIHPKAHVDPDTVRIGARTTVWQFASVIRGTILGEFCNVGSTATLDGPRFGDRCIISPGVDIGPGFRIGNDVFIGPNVVLCNDMWPETGKEGFNANLLRSGYPPCVVIHDGAAIGANAVVLPGVIIGAGAMVAAGATVDRNVPPGFLFGRNGYIGEMPPLAARRLQRMRTARVDGQAAALQAAVDDGTVT